MKCTMKYIFTLMILFTGFGPISSYSQVSVMATNDYPSPNKNFKLTVKGLVYEGYTGKQNITLKNRDDHILWKKNESICAEPIVSNRGIVALLGSNIRFFDSTGHVLGKYEINEFIETYWTDCADCSPGQLFSLDGNSYYTIIDSNFRVEGINRIQYLLCLSMTGEKLWQFEIIRNKPEHSSLQIGAEPFKGGILVYYMVGGKNRQNVCYLLSDSGRVIKKYEDVLGTGYYSIKIYDSKNIFTLQVGDSLKNYSLQTGSFVDSKYIESKATRAKRTNKK